MNRGQCPRHQYRQTPVGLAGVYDVLLRLAPASSKVAMPLCRAQAARTNNVATAAPLASPRRIFNSIIGTLRNNGEIYFDHPAYLINGTANRFGIIHHLCCHLCWKWRYRLRHNTMIASKYKTLPMADRWLFCPLPASQMAMSSSLLSGPGGLVTWLWRATTLLWVAQ